MKTTKTPIRLNKSLAMIIPDWIVKGKDITEKSKFDKCAKMKITISYKEYADLKILKEADAQELIQRFGKPNKKGYDGVLGDSFEHRYIGNYGFVAKHKRKAEEAREVYLCHYKGKYWISLNYGHSNHLDFPRNLRKLIK